MTEDFVSRPHHAPTLPGLLMIQPCGRWPSQAMQKSPGAATASAFPTVPPIVSLALINHAPPAKQPVRSVFAGMNQLVPSPTVNMTTYATYVLKTQETLV